MSQVQELDATNLIAITSDIIVAHASNNDVSVGELPGLITAVYGALADLGNGDAPAEEQPEPAVPVRASIKRDHLVCLEDGKKLKILKRHLMTEHNMTPTEYRRRWGLAVDYPMVAPDYAETRRDLAIKSGLGRQPVLKRGRRKKAS